MEKEQVMPEIDETESPDAPAAGAVPEPQSPDIDWKAMARKWEKEAKGNRQAASELAALKAKEQTEAERLAAERDAEAAKVKAAVRRAVSAEVKSVAAGFHFQDPADVLRMLNLDDYTDSEGEVDEDAIREAVKEIANTKPYLLTPAPSAAPARSGGTVGGGPPIAGQLSRADLRNMTPEEIVKAKEEGRLDQLLGVER